MGITFNLLTLTLLIEPLKFSLSSSSVFNCIALVSQIISRFDDPLLVLLSIHLLFYLSIQVCQNLVKFFSHYVRFQPTVQLSTFDTVILKQKHEARASGVDTHCITMLYCTVPLKIPLWIKITVIT